MREKTIVADGQEWSFGRSNTRYEPVINWRAVSVTLIVVGTILAMFICYIIT